MTDNQDTTRAALRHDGEALPRSAVNAGLDQAADRLLDEELATTALPARSASLTAPEADPVFRIGAQHGRLVARHHELDSEGVSTRGADRAADGARERLMSRIDDRLDFLREAASYQAASSIPGALAHLVMGSQFLNDIVERSDLDEDGREARINSVRRCIWSVAHVLAEVGGVSPRAFGSDYVMPEHLDLLSLAMAPTKPSDIIDGPKPTVPAPPDAGLVERQLVAMNEEAGVLWSLFLDAGRMEDQNSNPGSDKVRIARHRMGEMAEAHSRRRWMELLRRAIELPATTPREFGLVARLVAVELDEWWDDDELQFGEMTLRTLLGRLAAFSGMPRIDRGDVESSEIRDWLDRPEEHAKTYAPGLLK